MSVTRKDANQLKKGNYFLLDGKVHRVISEPQHSKSGKHGHAKMRIDSVNIYTGKKSSSTFPASQSIEIPNIEKRNAMVTHKTENVVGLMDNESYESFEVSIPDEDDLAAAIKPDINVEYWIVMDNKFIKRIV